MYTFCSFSVHSKIGPGAVHIPCISIHRAVEVYLIEVKIIKVPVHLTDTRVAEVSG